MSLLDFIFPRKCVGCSKEGSYFCEKCIKGIGQDNLKCSVCEGVSMDGATHPLCKKVDSLDGVWSLGLYKDPLKTAIHKLKYRWIIELANDLTNITIEYWARYNSSLLQEIKKNQGSDWLVTAVPLHKSRQNWRGFNQSELLGKLLAKKLGLNYQNLLVKTKSTKPQMSLNAYQRKKNLKDVFSLTTSYQLQTTNIILVDDVWTTGSTLKECCQVLKKEGARKVWGFTLAS
jgi:competence protein ComFC